MKLHRIAAVAALAAPLLASAGTNFLVDFEKSWGYGETVDASYAAQGVSFTNVLGLSNDENFTYYSGAPSPLGVASVQLDGVVNTTAYLNVAGGVDGALSFYYSTPSDITGAIKAYSGLDGTGVLLGSFDLTTTDAAYGVWNAATFNFSGTALSFDLSGAANVAGFDNISAVPEPSSIALMLAGGALVLRLRSRQRG